MIETIVIALDVYLGVGIALALLVSTLYGITGDEMPDGYVFKLALAYPIIPWLMVYFYIRDSSMRKLITDVIALTSEKEYGYMEEWGLIPNEPVPQVGQTLAIDDFQGDPHEFIVLSVNLEEGEDRGPSMDVRTVVVAENGLDVPPGITSLKHWEWYNEMKEGEL